MVCSPTPHHFLLSSTVGTRSQSSQAPAAEGREGHSLAPSALPGGAGSGGTSRSDLPPRLVHSPVLTATLHPPSPLLPPFPPFPAHMSWLQRLSGLARLPFEEEGVLTKRMAAPGEGRPALSTTTALPTSLSLWPRSASLRPARSTTPRCTQAFTAAARRSRARTSSGSRRRRRGRRRRGRGAAVGGGLGLHVRAAYGLCLRVRRARHASPARSEAAATGGGGGAGGGPRAAPRRLDLDNFEWEKAKGTARCCR